MLYKILADTVILLHFLWIVFLMFGAVPGVRNSAIKIVHISGLAFAVISELFDWYCPLTYLEIWLKSKYAPSMTYTGSFIIHYLEKIVYIEIPWYLITISIVLLCLFNGWVYIRKGRMKNA